MTTKFREKSFLIMISSLTTLALTLPFTSLCANTINDKSTTNDWVVFGIIEVIIVTIICVLYFQIIKNKSKAKAPDELHVAPEIISHYQQVRKKHEEQELQRLQEMTNLVVDYIHHTLSPYMSESDVQTVSDNVKIWVHNGDACLTAVATDGRLSSIDIRHLAWNIGERLKWDGQKRALFAKMVFPIEMKDVEVTTIRRNLRHRGTCVIDLDTPENGDLRFAFQLI